MTAIPDLASVTVCAADSLNPQLAARALGISVGQCRFGDAILFTDAEVDGPFRRQPIAPLRSQQDYSRFILRDLHAFITTPFVLVIQWDGYVLDGGAWDPAFLACDYIGAKWSWYPPPRVGNGGFSLRSLKLLRLCAELPAVPPELNEDEVVCRIAGPRLAAEHGIVFASEALADRFSYERDAPEQPTFGFHGVFNFWREVPDLDMIGIAGVVSEATLFGREAIECMLTYSEQRRFGPLTALYRSWRRFVSAEEATARLERVVGPDQARRFVQFAEVVVAARQAAPVQEV